MAPEGWAKELSAEFVMGVSDGLGKKVGFVLDDDAKVTFAKEIYPLLLDFVHRIQNDAVEGALAAIERQRVNEESDREGMGYRQALNDTATAVRALLRRETPEAPELGSWEVIRRFLEMPLSKRRELLGDYYLRTPSHLDEFKRIREAFVALKADGKVDEFLRSVAESLAEGQ